MNTKKKNPKNNKLSGDKQATTIPPWVHGLAWIAIIFLGSIIYSNSFDCSFHFDDKPNILNNSHIREISFQDPQYSFSNTRLVGYFSFALNYQFGGFNVWGYHLFNLWVHLLNACLIYGLVLLLFSTPELIKHPAYRHRSRIGLAIALLFVAHPLATQSVTYIVQRLASMVTLFYLASVFFYLKARLSGLWNNRSVIYFFLSAVSAGLAFMTKENAFTLPVTLLLTEICFFQPKMISVHRTNYRLFVLVGLLAASVAFAVFRFSFAVLKPIPPSFGNAYTLTSSTYLYTQFSVILKYIQLLFLPIHQNLDYDYPLSYSLWEPRTLLSLVVLLGVLVAAFRLFKNHRLVSFGIFWFFITLAIESSIVPISDVIFEHRTYLPSFGFLLAVFMLGYEYLGSRRPEAAIGVFIAVLLTFSAMAYNRNKIWRNNYTLNQDIVSKSPEKSRANCNMAMAYVDLGKLDSALYYFDKAVALNNDYYDAHNNRGITLMRLNRVDPAMVDFSACIRLDPSKPKAYCNRANGHGTRGEYQEALADYSAALAIDSLYFDAYKNRGITFLNTGKYESAVADFNKTIAIDPQNEEVRKLFQTATERLAVQKTKAVNIQ